MLNNQKHEMLTSGQFGRFVQLSRKALRLYESRDLLPPAQIDPATGYRYYTREQIHIARRIRLLRMMDMPLESIALVLSSWVADVNAVQRLIRAQEEQIHEKVSAVHLAARLLREELTNAEESHMSFSFSETAYNASTVISIRRRITMPAFQESNLPTLCRLWEHIKANDAGPVGEPVCLYYGPINESDDGPVEIGVPVSKAVLPSGDIKVREIPAHKAIQIRTYGEYNRYPKIQVMWDAIGKYVNENGIEPNWAHDMATYEIWHEDDSITICWPVQSYR